MTKQQKRKKFEKSVSLKLKNVLISIKKLEKLSNEEYYDYDQEDIKKIFKTINKELKYTISRFHYRKDILTFIK